MEGGNRQDQLRGDPGANPELAGGTICPVWPGTALGSPWRSWKVLLGKGGLECSSTPAASTT